MDKTLSFIKLLPELNDDTARDDTLRVVRRSIGLLNRGWCRLTRARKWGGWVPCRVNDPKATHFCLTGAIQHACWERNINSFQIFQRLRFITGVPIFTDYNDARVRTKEDVVNLLRKAEAALTDNSRNAAVFRRSAGL